MRLFYAAMAGLAAACLITTAAEAGKSDGGKFAICDPSNQQYLKDLPRDPTAKGGLKSSYTLSRGNVLTLLEKHWSRGVPTTATMNLFSAAWAYGGEGKSAKDNPDHPVASGFDPNTLGAIYDLFVGKADIGSGYVESVIPGPNTKLSGDLLKDWANEMSNTHLVCGWKDPDDKTAADSGNSTLMQRIWDQRNHALIRNSASSLEQALAHKIDAAFDTPKNSAASLAFTHDQLDHTANTFTMHAALGLGYEFERSDSWHDGIVGYAGVDRVNNADPTKAKNNLTDIYSGVGYVWTYHMKPDDAYETDPNDWGLRAAIHLQGDTDDKFGASMVYVGAQISPWVNRGFCFGSTPTVVAGLFRITCGFDLDMDYAHIFNAGGFINLKQKEYARGGAEVSATVGGPELSDSYVRISDNPLTYVGAILSHLSYTASYKALHDLTGSGSGLARFDSSLDYNLGGEDGGQSTSISLTYVNGRADRTLEKERAWGLSLNISY